MKEFWFRDPDMQVEIDVSDLSDPEWPIEIILPSMISITAEQARRFADALIRAADAASS